MSAKYAHITQPSVLSVIDASDEIRDRHIMLPICIEHPEWLSVLAHLEYLFEIPPTQQAEHMLLISDSGLGKTHLLCETIAARYPASAAPGVRAQHPVLYYETPVTSDLREFQAMLLHRMGAPDPAVTWSNARNSLIVRLLQEAKVRLLIIDELNHLSLCAERHRLQIYNWIKHLANITNIPIVLAGAPGCEQPIVDDPQLKSRFTLRELHPWKVGPDLASFLLAMEGCLPLRKPSYLHKREMVKAIFDETQGITKKILICLRHAARTAIYGGQEFISADLLTAYRAPKLARHFANAEGK